MTNLEAWSIVYRTLKPKPGESMNEAARRHMRVASARKGKVLFPVAMIIYNSSDTSDAQWRAIHRAAQLIVANQPN